MGTFGYGCPLMCYPALHSGLGYAACCSGSSGASGSRLFPADLGSKYKEEAIVSLAQAPSWDYSLFLKDEYISDSLSECGLRSSDPRATLSYHQIQGPPFPTT